MIGIQTILCTSELMKGPPLTGGGLNASARCSELMREQEITVAKARVIERVLQKLGITDQDVV